MSQKTLSIVEQRDVNVTQSTNNGIPILRIEHPQCHAALSLYAGHVLSWQPQGHSDVFWLSENTHYQDGKAIRGGIPLCWPWFGAKEGEVNHGFARTSLWQLTKVTSSDEGVEVVLTFEGDAKAATWPFAFKVTQTLFFGEEFSQTLDIFNTGEYDFEHDGALHSYFSVSQPEQTCVPELSQVRFFDKLDGCEKMKTLNDCRGPKDRIYFTHQDVQLLDYGLNRKIKLSAHGTSTWILWNPGTESADAMADVHAGGEKEFVCLEAGFTEPLTLSAGDSVSIRQVIKVSHIS